jgi:hypothetical protein
MKQIAHRFLFLPLAIAFIGCSTVEPKLPPGVYRENSSQNVIHVSSETMGVHIEGVDHRDTNDTGLTFTYVLWPSGRIFLMVQRSAELMYGYPGLEYHWDGAKIVARDPKSERKWEFTR